MSQILGVSKRWYPGEPEWGDAVCLCTVLVAGDIGDYAAYQGIGNRPDWIAAHGDKISFAEACVHFPGGQLEEGRYRV